MGNNIAFASLSRQEEEEEEEEKIYFPKQKHRVQSVVCLNTIISNNKKILHYSIKEYMYLYKYSDGIYS